METPGRPSKVGGMKQRLHKLLSTSKKQEETREGEVKIPAAEQYKSYYSTSCGSQPSCDSDHTATPTSEKPRTIQRARTWKREIESGRAREGLAAKLALVQVDSTATDTDEEMQSSEDASTPPLPPQPLPEHEAPEARALPHPVFEEAVEMEAAEVEVVVQVEAAKVEAAKLAAATEVEVAETMTQIEVVSVDKLCASPSSYSISRLEVECKTEATEAVRHLTAPEPPTRHKHTAQATELISSKVTAEDRMAGGTADEAHPPTPSPPPPLPPTASSYSKAMQLALVLAAACALSAVVVGRTRR